MTTPEISDELRTTVRAELPEIEEISDSDLRDKVVEAWDRGFSRLGGAKYGTANPAPNPLPGMRSRQLCP